MTILSLFITSQTRRKIITIYCKYPEYRTHVRGLAKVLREDPGNIQRELRKLERAGFLKSARSSNVRLYWANKNFPLYKELQSMVLKTSRRNLRRI